MEILFCGKCGVRISSEAANEGDGEKLCGTCRAEKETQKSGKRPTRPTSRRSTPGRARSDRLTPPALSSERVSRATPRPPADAFRKPKGTPSDSRALLISGVVIVIVLLVAGGVLLQSLNTPTTPAKNVATAPKKRSQPTRSTPEPRAAQPPEADRKTPGPPVTTALSSSNAKAAEEAFDQLRRFDGLAADDRDGRIRRIEAFLAEHGQQIIASRARVMLRELKAPQPPQKSEPSQEKPPASQSTAPPPPTTEGWKTVRGPFTFENGQLNNWKGDDGSVVDVGEFEGRKCLRAKPGNKLNCRAWRGSAMDSAGLRVRFRYFAHDVQYVELVWAQGTHRPRKRIQSLVRDGWAEACFTGREVGSNASRLMHVEIGGPGKSNGSFLLLDDIVVERQ